MEIWQLIVLALIQGMTEFLPISSSAHLLLPSIFLGWPDQGLVFDIAVHLGSLLAVMVYFRQQLTEVVIGGLQSLTGKQSEAGHLAWCIVIATIPAGLAGLAFGDIVETQLRGPEVIAATTVIGAVLLWFADKRSVLGLNLNQLTLLAALLIGCAQALAIMPGMSRSGSTLTMALLLGFARTDAARFSFLMAVPIILLSAGLKGMELIDDVDAINVSHLLLGVVVSAVSAWLCIHYFLRLITQIGMLPFVIYRLLLGMILIILMLAS